MTKLQTLADTRPITDAGPATSRITLGIPTRGQMASHTTRTLLELTLWDSMYGRGWLRHDKPSIWIVGASLITNSRNTLVKQFLALDDQPEWLLFLDDDQLYPANLLEHLMLAVEQVERTTKQSCLAMGVPVWRFEGGATNDVRSTHNVFTFTDDGQQFKPLDELPDNAVVQVAAVGAGCLLVHRVAFEMARAASAKAGFGDAECWFRHIAWPINEGEDIYFCRLLAHAGVPLFVTTTPGYLEHVKQIRLDRAYHRGELTV